MATRIYGVAPGASMALGSVIEDVGPTATSAVIALVIDLAASVTDAGATRTVSKEEVLLGLETLKNYILADQWPPA